MDRMHVQPKCHICVYVLEKKSTVEQSGWLCWKAEMLRAKSQKRFPSMQSFRLNARILSGVRRMIRLEMVLLVFLHQMQKPVSFQCNRLVVWWTYGDIGFHFATFNMTKKPPSRALGTVMHGHGHCPITLLTTETKESKWLLHRASGAFFVVLVFCKIPFDSAFLH